MRKGIVYALYSPSLDKYYIGSTIRPLKQRLEEHKNDNNLCYSKIIIKAGDYEVKILNEINVAGRKELNNYEAIEMKKYKDKIVNTHWLGLTRKETVKKYHESEKCKKKREDEKYKNYMKNYLTEYRKTDEYKEKMREYFKEYRKKQKNKI